MRVRRGLVVGVASAWLAVAPFGAAGTVQGSVIASASPAASPAMMTFDIRDCRTSARIWRGVDPPGNDPSTGDLTGSLGVRLRTGDHVTVETPPVAGGSYDSGCSGGSDYRWYRLHERNGKRAAGWVSAQVLASAPPASSTDPAFPAWGEPASISELRVDDVASDSDGSLHTVTETDAGIVYATDRSGAWISELVYESGSREPGSRARFAVTPRIDVSEGLVAIVFGDRRHEAGDGDCAPGPCWDYLGATVMVGSDTGWTSTSFDDLTTDWESADHAADVRVHGSDVYVSDGLRLATRIDGRWTEETVPLSYRRTDQWGDTLAALEVDTAGSVHVTAMDYLGRQLGYARRDPSGWTSSAIRSGRGVLSGITTTHDGHARIGYSSAEERYPGELCGGDCAVFSTYHLVTVDGAAADDRAVPGDGWGVLAADAAGGPMVARWGDPGIAWRRSTAGTWQTTSWDVPGWIGSFDSHEEVGGVQPHGLWVLRSDGAIAVVFEPRGGGTWAIEATDPA